jgi:hypothetical protein
MERPVSGPVKQYLPISDSAGQHAEDSWPHVNGQTYDPRSGNAGTGVPAHPSALFAVVGGDAMAFGDRTDAIGMVTNHVENRGAYTIATGEAIFSAAGYSSNPGGAAATANTFVDVTGADFLFEVNFHAAGRGADFAWAASETEYVAVDLPNWSPPGGTVVVNLMMRELAPHALGLDEGHGGITIPPGNLAHVLATADAQGADGLAATLTHALTVENHFSAVSGLAMVIF